MTARDYGWVALPSLGLLVAAPAVELATDSRQLPLALAAVALTLPAALVTLRLLSRSVRERSPKAAIGMIAGKILRMTVAIGGGALVVLATEWGRTAGFSFWIWLVVAYLSTLAAEVFVLAKPGWVGRGVDGRKG